MVSGICKLATRCVYLRNARFCVVLNCLLIGEDRNSYGFGGTGKFSENSQFTDYGKSFQLNDVVGAYLVSNADFIFYSDSFGYQFNR
jgi:hypothetical protein